ncbi:MULTISPECIES: hypothetical protein [Salinirubellus]
MSQDTPDFDALQEFLESDAYESERDRVDEQMYSPVTDTFTKQRRSYVEQDEYGGELSADGKAAFDAEPAFGMVLTNARSALDDGISVNTDSSKPIIQVPLWTYLRLE